MINTILKRIIYENVYFLTNSDSHSLALPPASKTTPRPPPESIEKRRSNVMYVHSQIVLLIAFDDHMR
jgi:hypothetical protein